MSRIVGIDLGTTNSLVATVDSGIPLVIADADGQRLMPSVVHFPAPGAEPIVGHKANRVRVLQPAETVYSVKRFIGRTAVTELLAPDEVFRDAVLQKLPTRALQNVAIQQGMQTMWQDGLRRVLKGQTTLEEILRVIAVDQI